MAGFTAINDKGMRFLNVYFKTCIVSFVKNAPKNWPINKPFKLSQLANVRLGKYKDKIICFCNGIIEIPKKILPPKLKAQDEFSDEVLEKEVLELEARFNDLNQVEIDDVKEDREFLYYKDKKNWVNTFSNNERLTIAIREGYDCDEQYCIERLGTEMPGFFIVDETTFFWKDPYPTLEALSIEKHIKTQVNGQKTKYGTYTKICLLEEHNKQKYDTEAIIIFNYLNKFDVIALLSTLIALDKKRHEQQLECEESEILSD